MIHIPASGSPRKAANPAYERYHPKWYRPRTPIFWWLKKLPYVKFIVREMTSIAVAYAAVFLLAVFWVLSRGETAWEQFVTRLQSPVVVVFHALMFLPLLIHSVTWLNLAPRALVVRVGDTRVPDAAVLVGHYGAWLVGTAVVIWYLLGF